MRMGAVDFMVPGDALPAANEDAVARCAICGWRQSARNLPIARKALGGHRKETGHDVGTLFRRLKRKKQPGRRGNNPGKT